MWGEMYFLVPRLQLRALCLTRMIVSQAPSLHIQTTHIDGVPLEDAQLQKELQFDLPFLEQFLHLALSLVQLLQHALDVSHGAVVGSFVA